MRSDCDETGRLLSQFLDGTMPPERRPEVEAHLGRCDACRAALDAWSRIGVAAVDLLRQAIPVSPVGPEPATSTTRRLKYRRPREARRAWIPLLAAAGILVALSVLAAVLSSTPKRNFGDTARPPAPPAEPEAPEPESPAPPAPQPVRPEVPRESPPVPTPVPELPEAPKPVPAPPPPRPPEPKPEPPRKDPPRETVAALARLEQVRGNVTVHGLSARVPAKAAQTLVAGEGLVTSGRGSLAVIVFPDGTRVEAGPDTEISKIADAEGKRIVLDRGFVEANVTPQPPGRPLVLATPNAEARVLGTTLRLFAEHEMTRLEVEKGRVRLQRLSDQKSVEVLTGHFAVAATGIDLAPRAIPSRPAVVSFTLINADTEQPIAGHDPIKEGAVLNLSKLPTRNLNVRANVTPRKVGSVRFSLDGVESPKVENGTTGPVYSLAGDMNGKYNAWVPAPGAHTVTATPYPEPDAKGPPGTALSVTFRVVAK